MSVPDCQFAGRHVFQDGLTDRVHVIDNKRQGIQLRGLTSALGSYSHGPLTSDLVIEAEGRRMATSPSIGIHLPHAIPFCLSHPSQPSLQLRRRVLVRYDLPLLLRRPLNWRRGDFDDDRM